MSAEHIRVTEYVKYCYDSVIKHCFDISENIKNLKERVKLVKKG